MKKRFNYLLHILTIIIIAIIIFILFVICITVLLPVFIIGMIMIWYKKIIVLLRYYKKHL